MYFMIFQEKQEIKIARLYPKPKQVDAFNFKA